MPFFDDYIEFLFALMLFLALLAIALARYLQISRIGQGLAAIRDDELAAECAGVPTLRLKLVSTTVMGALMAMAGAPYPFFVTYVDPLSAFNLVIAVNAIAMPMIGGTATWYGPVVGALLLGSIQEIATVTISSEVNVLIVGVLLVLFIIVAPQGIVGLIQGLGRKRRAMAERILEVIGPQQAVRRLRRARCREPASRPGRAPRPDRPERLRQDHLDQLHLRRAACDGGRVLFKGQDVTRLPAHRRVRLGITRSFQIPRPFRSMSVIENLCVPLEYARPERDRGRHLDDEAIALLELVGLEARAHDGSADLTQVDLRKLELARALAAGPRCWSPTRPWPGLSSAEVDDILSRSCSASMSAASR